MQRLHYLPDIHVPLNFVLALVEQNHELLPPARSEPEQAAAKKPRDYFPCRIHKLSVPLDVIVQCNIDVTIFQFVRVWNEHCVLQVFLISALQQFR